MATGVTRGRVALTLMAPLVMSCSDTNRSSAARTNGTTPDSTPVARAELPDARPSQVDSAHSPEEMLRRFRVGLDSTAALRGGAASRDELARRFVRALSRTDTAAFRGLMLDRAEFAWLFFPSNRIARPPYAIDPALLWMQLVAGSENGLARLIEPYGRPGVRMAALDCPAPPQHEGQNTLWSRCILALVQDGDTTRLRAFGSILERDGRFKFVSYSNDL